MGISTSESIKTVALLIGNLLPALSGLVTPGTSSQAPCTTDLGTYTTPKQVTQFCKNPAEYVCTKAPKLNEVLMSETKDLYRSFEKFGKIEKPDAPDTENIRKNILTFETKALESRGGRDGFKTALTQTLNEYSAGAGLNLSFEIVLPSEIDPTRVRSLCTPNGMGDNIFELAPEKTDTSGKKRALICPGTLRRVSAWGPEAAIPRLGRILGRNHYQMSLANPSTSSDSSIGGYDAFKSCMKQVYGRQEDLVDLTDSEFNTYIPSMVGDLESAQLTAYAISKHGQDPSVAIALQGALSDLQGLCEDEGQFDDKNKHSRMPGPARIQFFGRNSSIREALGCSKPRASLPSCNAGGAFPGIDGVPSPETAPPVLPSAKPTPSIPSIFDGN